MKSEKFSNAVSEANALVHNAVDNAIKAGQEVGVQVCAYYNGNKIADVSLGRADRDGKKNVTPETLFNIWSVSKGISATCLHVLAERGCIDYEAPVADYWPEFAAHGKGGVTVRHILTHRSGVPHLPEDVTPDRAVDWEWMVKEIANLKPLAEPGEKPMYQGISFGWLVGELVRRTDPKHRDINTFLQEEINQPLGIDGLWFGVPDQYLDRVANIIDDMGPMDPSFISPLWEKCLPQSLRFEPDVFEQTSVRKGIIPGVGGLANARSVARVFAMMANGGELDGVRLLSRDRVAKFHEPRPGANEPDPVMFGQPMSLSTSGFWLFAEEPITNALKTRTAFGNPGVGNSLAWADMEENLAVSFCHNRMSQPQSVETDPFQPIAAAIREGVALIKAQGQ